MAIEDDKIYGLTGAQIKDLPVKTKAYADGIVATETTARETADNGLQAQIDAITASSDVVDVVDTKADLDDYDTTKLHDNDIVKVLEDETHSDAISYYRWGATAEAFTYIGSQGPFYTKAETDGLLNDKVDKVTGKGLSTEDFTTAEKTKLAGIEAGSAKVLTVADYNYPSSSPNSIALWLLEPGYYNWSTTVSANVKATTTVTVNNSFGAIVAKPSNNVYSYVLYDGSDSGKLVHVYSTSTAGGIRSGFPKKVVHSGNLVDDLTSTAVDTALTANQGKVLKDLIDTRVPQATTEEADKFLRGDGMWASAGSASVSNHTLFV